MSCTAPIGVKISFKDNEPATVAVKLWDREVVSVKFCKLRFDIFVSV